MNKFIELKYFNIGDTKYKLYKSYNFKFADIKRLDKKIDDNYEKLDKKIERNAKDTSEIFQEICKRLDQNKIPKRKIAIL